MLNTIRKAKDSLKVLQFRATGLVKKRQLLASDTRSQPIGIIGLGAVGLTLGLTLADLGFKVCGYDISDEVKASLKKGKPHFFEIGLEELLKKHVGKSFSLVDDFLRENSCGVYFINVGSPLDEENTPNLSYITTAARELGKIIKQDDLIILRSTVPVGTTRTVVVPEIEKVSGLKAGRDFLIAFSPERTVEGKALVDLRSLPQVVGGINRASAERAAEVLKYVTNDVIITDGLESAELVKLINNTYRDLNFAFANEISLIARKWGVSARGVIDAANTGYHRSNVPYPSPGVGGYCLPKDNYIFLESARSAGHEPQLFHRSREVSDTIIEKIAEDIACFADEHHGGRNAKVLVAGFAYKGKPPTSDTRGSTTFDLVKQLRKKNMSNIFGHDHLVNPKEIASTGVAHEENLANGFNDAAAVVVMTNNPVFEGVDIGALLAKSAKPTLLLDPWALYNPDTVNAIDGIHYQTL